MLFGINVVYLLILVAVSLGLIFGMRALQKAVLAELSRTLYEDNDPDGYSRMLESRLILLVLRRGTVALMRLDGALFSGSPDAVNAACANLEGIKLKPEERLNWYQKALSSAVVHGDGNNAKLYLERIEALLEREPDASLQAVCAEARQLYGVYILRDVSLIGALEKESGSLSGARLGIVLYRLAKLHHFAGDDANSTSRLKAAIPCLNGSAWLDVAERAMDDLSVLEYE